ncbi:inositol monophosphatase family protein [Marivita sp. XM-24bin2]|jgi:myo-inositol-1(or 4)-monophosphatase|uniref:inositol monophosphatase family protein n=1 Tax=unclassified Marivita TaxID=2632480 RepID=UPI000D7A8B83|nr:inositol monophosphatase family protein [Marivita sp. XM-24bin2]MCR9110712.1 inositol monophosphatase [Paracoccaceae bacterium]PWL33389.1 MAG: inositol monophosphatase [Marivita sp. XM-24bin2]
MVDLSERKTFAVSLAHEAGALALDYFSRKEALVVDQKGAQDWVSEADRNVEIFVREKIEAAFPDDGIVGEEHAPKAGTSGFDWVIDPIDGTTNFVNGIPAWTIVLAVVSDRKTQIGIIYEPNVNETYVAVRGQGVTLNDQPISVAKGVALTSGTVSVGYSNRVEASNVLPVITALVERGALYHRNASGALSLAYVAAGRLLGYVEEHMNAWDCLAAQLMIAEAGGVIEDQDAQAMIRTGGRVIAGTPEVFDTLKAICEDAWRE